MTWRTWVVCICFTLGWCSPVLGGEQFPASVKKIIDGDSLLVSAAKETIEVRLYGVDCPEYDQPFSREAKNFSEERVLGKQVMIEPVTEDAYGRTVAIVARGKNVLNKELVQAGLAWVYPRYCRKAFCESWKSGERQAREEKIGLWQDARPESPWQWKHNKRGRRVE